ncbi:carbohydrate-binding family 9-like protein [Clostridium paraputrificum]|uniref:carbohydrate-binding family 9-like protein n=1 Tax=Clostridium TaxID=1485 RepID=UPI003D3512E4
MYVIKKISDTNLNKNFWDDIEPIRIENYPWDETGYKPETEVKLCYTQDEILVKFKSCEKQVRIETKEFNGPSWFDSCVEFFFLPEPETDDRYFNFEITARGTLLLQLDNRPPERHYMNYINPNYFEIKADVTDDNYRDFDNFKPWTIEYKIPFVFIKDFFKDFEVKSGKILKANFSKCGDETLIPHFGTWANIDNPVPAFHMPEFFKEIIFE